MKTRLMVTSMSAFLVLCGLAALAIACPPPQCPDCYIWDPYTGHCEWNCPQGDICCNGSCCDGSCCNGICYDPDVKKCCTDIFFYYLCNRDQTCCYGKCCDEKCCWYYSYGMLLSYCCESDQICCIDDCLTCPTQTSSGVDAQCGELYGGTILLRYSGAQNWWFVEHVSAGTCTCTSGCEIGQTGDPVQRPEGYILDVIMNTNGPPTAVGPCSDTTYQTIYCGPTLQKVYCCSYENTQVISVSSGSSPGTVTTSSAGKSVECSY